MRKTLNRYIRKFKKDRAKRRRFGTMLCALALVVVAGVFWQLRLIGISMTDETGSFDANADLENSSVWEENIPELTEDLVAESIRAMKFEGENYTAAVSFDENAQIPENAELQVTKLTTDTERYVEGVQEALGEGRTLSSVYLFDISIVCDGEIIEPAEGSNVSVNVNFPEKIIADDEQLDVVHFKNDQDPEFLENASLLPNGELGGDSVEFVSDSFSVMAFAVSTRANEEEPVPIPYAAENIEMHLFNYGSNINNTEGFLLEFLHMENKESNGKYGYMPVDGWGHKGQYYPNKFTVDRTLTDGYPTITPWDTAIESKSLRYLFDKTMTEVIGTPHSDGDCTRSPLKSDYASRHYAILNDGSGTGLFQKDSEGYLYYDSAENAASYNSESKKMDLYGYTVKPHKESRLNGFLPFNVGHQGEKLSGTSYALVSDYDPNNPAGSITNSRTDLWFGMTAELDFFIQKDGQISGKPMEFEFSGDDDVLVYIDDVLVLDISGIHNVASGSINFATGEVKYQNSTTNSTGKQELIDYTTTIKAQFEAANQDVSKGFTGDRFADYTKHHLKFFYMERGGNLSNCKLKFNLDPIPPKSLTVAKELTDTGNADEEMRDFIKDSLTYKFRVMKEAEDGLFIAANTAYKHTDADRVETTRATDAEGYFYLKADETAQFQYESDDGQKFYVQEIMPNDTTGQYGGVDYIVGSDVGNTIEGSEGEDFTAYNSPILTASWEPQFVIYRNKVDVSKLNDLSVEKKIAPGSTFEPEKEFTIEVKLGDELLPVGTKYQVGDETKTVTEAGKIILKGGEKADILAGILTGTKVTVTEEDGSEYHAVYDAHVTDGEGQEQNGWFTTGDDGSSIVGEIKTPDSDVLITVTNSTYAKSVQIPIQKTLIGGAEGDSYTFSFSVEEVDQSGASLTPAVFLPGISLTPDSEENYTSSGNITFNFQDGDTGTHYYKIKEVKGENPYSGIRYDESWYLVEVNADTETVTSVKKYDNAEDTVGEEISAPYTCSFINSKTVSLTVTKTVEGGTMTGNFDFELRVWKPDGTAYTEPLKTDGGNVLNAVGDKYTFQLQHNGSITIEMPYGCKYTVEETKASAQGYITSVQCNGGEVQYTLGHTTDSLAADETVAFQNITGYELPETGGSGTLFYTLIGMLLMVMSLLISCHKE